MIRLQLLSALAAVSVAGLSSRGGTFTTITVDGSFTDWAGVPVLTSDAAGDGNPIDIADVQIANDADNLYLRVNYHTPVNPNVGPSIYLAFDTDRNVATGFNVYGLSVVGSEAAFQNDFPFEQRTGFNSGSLTAAATISPVDFGDPGNVFSSQEYSIPRNVAYSSDSVPVFGTGFNLMLWTDSGIAADTTIGISYDFATPVNSFINVNGGDYNLPVNWSAGTVPNAVDAAANFGSAISSTQTVFSNAAVSLGKLSFDNANQYLFGGTGSLTMDASTGSAAIDVLQGSHKINLPLTLNDSTAATVAAGATLTIGDPLTFANSSGLTKAGAGTLEIISTVGVAAGGFSSISTSAGTTNLRLQMGAGISLASSGGETRTFTTQRVNSVNISGGSVAIDSAGTVKVLVTDALTLSGTAKLDVGDNGMIVRGGNAATIRADVATGRGGASGIVTTASTTNRGVGYASSTQIGNPATFLGEVFTGAAVLVRYTLLGDTNLSGGVDFADLVPFAQNYNGTSKEWFQGDFDYDGDVDFQDLIPLAQNYNGTVLDGGEPSSLSGGDFAADWALARSLVPEPTTLSLLGGLTTVALRRRR
jgi:hypothetical protein